MIDLDNKNFIDDSENVNVRETLDSYIKYWYFFVFTIIICSIVAFIYLRYAPVIYKTSSTIVIKDDSNGGLPEGFSQLSNFGGVFSKINASKLQNDLVILKSKKLHEITVKSLDLNIVYKADGNFKDSELYKNNPIVVKYLSFKDSIKNEYSRAVNEIGILIKSETQFQISSTNNTIYNFGDAISLPFGEITVLPSSNYQVRLKSFIDKKIIVSYNAIENVALAYQTSINVSNAITNSNVVELTTTSTVPEKAENYIDELIFQFNKDAVNDQSLIAEKTSNFIKERLEIISRELDSVEGNKEQFKTSNRLTDIEAEVAITLENSNEFERQQFNIGTQLELSKTMIAFINDASSDELLPPNIGLNAENVGQAVSSYNQLVLERNRLLENSTSKNPVIINITNQIEQLRTNIKTSLVNSRNSLQLTMKDLNIQESSMNRKIAQVPTNEKLFRDIERQQSIKEQLYLFLLTQREQSNISLTVTAPKLKVVDPAFTDKLPVSPNKIIIYVSAILAGLIIPFLILYVSRLLSTTIKSRKDIEGKLPNLSILGEIPKLRKGQKDLIHENDRSVLAESFRILRTNLQYLFVNENIDESKRIFVTSTIKGEGKTFVAFNLALSLSSMKKKVILIGADIRNPQLHRYLSAEFKHSKGLTEFIVNDTLEVKDLVLKSDYIDIDILLSGVIPPNPAELLMHSRVEEVFKQLEAEYDYIIVDTAPSMLVTDTILINKYADVMLYVARAGYTDKRLLNFPKDAVADKRLHNVNFVLNGVTMSNFGYGNKYGYAYGVEKETFTKKIKKLFGR